MDALSEKPTRSLVPALSGAIRLTLALSALAFPVVGCAGESRPGQSQQPPALLAGAGGATPARLAGAGRLAVRFARVYAGGAYRRRAPRVRAESAAVRRALAAAAARVPPRRRGLRPRLVGIRLWLGGDGTVEASARVGDGRSPPFSIGFVVSRRAGGWLITSVSPPD